VKPGFGLAVGTEPADSKVSDRPRVRGKDVGQCVQALLLPTAELVVDDEVQGVECQRGRHHRERTVVRTPYLLGRWDMLVTNISSGRLLMKSMFAGGSCGSCSTRPRLLAGSSSISQQAAILGGGACR
jgi:hypothetical protein